MLSAQGQRTQGQRRRYLDLGHGLEQSIQANSLFYLYRQESNIVYRVTSYDHTDPTMVIARLPIYPKANNILPDL